MGNLQGKVKSGELSMEELEATMKRIGQVENMEKRLKAMGDQSGAASPKVDALGKDIKGAGDKSEKMGDQAGIGFGKLAAAVGVGQLAAKAFTAALDAGFAAVRGTIQGFTDALDLGGTLSDLSASTGESAGNLLLLQRAFDNTGAGADKVGPAIAKLQNNIFGAGEGSKEAVAAFGRMGLSMEDLAGKTPTQQLALVASGLTSIEDPSKRAATAIDVFGKSGAELLPLLTNFSGEMDEARATVGSMADIMDRRANVFDAVGDRFLIISQKVRDFAAGILDKALPAIDAITSALSRIDAAAVGQNLADAFLGGEHAMKGFQAAVDAISIGKVGLAFEVFWESLKLQAMQTADEIYKRLIAAFQSAGQFLAEIFSPSGALISTVLDGFDLLGARIAETIQSKLADALSGNMLTQGISDNLRAAAEESKLAADKISESMTGAGGRIADQFVNAGKALPDSFSENYAKIPPLFDDLAAQQTKVAELEGQVTAATAATTAERATQAAQSEAELAARQALKDQQAAADAQAKADKTAIIELETQLNAAKATGNTELVASLEKDLERKKATEEIAKLTDDYVKTLGVNANEAARLANNFVNARNAANDIANRNVIVTVTTKVNRQEYDELMASINAGTKDPKTLEILFKTTGKTDFDEAYKTLQNMQAINKNFDVALKVSGAESLEEVWQNLNSIPTTKQIQLGMEITGKDTYDEVIRSLPTFAGTKTAKLLLEQQGFENMTSFLNTLKGIPDEKRLKLIAETLGTADVNAAKAALDQVLINDGKKATVSVGADTSEANQKIQSVRQSTELPLKFMTETDVSAVMSEIDRVKETALQPLTLKLEGDASNVSAQVKDFEGDPINFSLEADDTAASKKIDALGADPITLSLGADTASAQEKIKELESEKLEIPTTIKIDRADFSAQLKDIQTEMNNSFSGGTGGSGGSGGEGGQGGAGGNATADIGTLQKVVETIKNLVEKIEPKLPTHALA
jgi:hypothetical protein